MSLKPRFLSETEPLQPATIAPLMDDLEYGRLAAHAAAFRNATEQRDEAIELLTLDRELAHVGTAASVRGERLRQLRRRAELLRARQPAPMPASAPAAPPPEAEGLPQPIVRALPLLAGESIPPEADDAARVARLRAEITVLHKAEAAVSDLMNRIRADRSYEVARAALPQFNAILRSKFDAAMALAATVQAERELVTKMILAGYDPKPDVLRSPPLEPAQRLGAPTEWDSAISTFRRLLEQFGVL